MRPTIMDAYTLMQEGALALAEVEASGICVDVPRLDRAIASTEKEIKDITIRLKSDRVWKRWKDTYGDRANLGSRPQLGSLLYGEMGYVSEKVTRTGRAKVDEEALDKINLPFVKDFRRLEKLKKLKSTNLEGIRREVVEGFLHTFFNLHLVQTYRSSSDSPNFQNFPIRDAEIGELIRSCFIPRPGHVLVEIDYGALEFRVSSCFWRDKKMVAYASNPKLDIHRDLASECFLLDEVPKQARFYAKNGFVFPILYGSYYISCARNLWNAIETAGLKTADGVPLRKHLKSKGITKLGSLDPDLKPKKGTFEYHIKTVEDRFHGRFPEWSIRKDKWWKRYQETGYFDLMTGFRCSGVFKRNHLYNWPIQGPAFHLLLWSLTQLVKHVRQNKMESRVVGQIHDSILADVKISELDDYINTAVRIMTQDVRDHWSWVIVPLEAEVDVAESNWYEKKPWVKKGQTWGPK